MKTIPIIGENPAPEQTAMNTCASCPSFNPVTSMGGECRFKPPQAVLIPTQDALGQNQIAIQSFFPRVEVDQWCSYHPERQEAENDPQE